LIGGLLQAVFDWRAQFIAAGALGLLVLVTTLVRLPETNRMPLARLRLGDTMRGYGTVVRSLAFTRYTLANALVFGGLFGFLAGSPAIFVEHLGVSPTEYGLYPPITTSGFIFGGIVTRRLAGVVSSNAIAIAGLCLLSIGSIVMLILPGIDTFNRYTITATMVVYITGLGVFAPMAIAGALSLFGALAGTASSVVGFAQMAGGALGTLFVAALHDSFPIRAFPITMAAMTLAALAVFLLIRPRSPAD
jgi:DHA1 family bicyclomycin/chloramphenicol resistance-like MFS transporter